ncbi:unnamed protein product [Medioppia subpectinata]|uniref:Uncharacterized protein n=1 Tax=Medioppia subpectinata TaxID=1979941 RepID=A0A7R9PUM6_9ACAR|nr:unnamed protein product [Medioppia subpectinata]CAG2101745.1 unnamed protein product [Medioppia subpectinata]
MMKRDPKSVIPFKSCARWNRSIKECQRLFDYIIQLTPHQVMDTLSVNNAKQSIQLLTKPLADITKNIADNVKQCQIHKLRIVEQMSNTGRKPQSTPTIELVYTPLRHPKLVCTNTQCSTITVIDAVLQCRAFNKYSNKDREFKDSNSNSVTKITKSEFCHKCGHSYREHLGLTYETIEQHTTIPADTDISTVGLQTQIQRLDRRIAELNAESETIINSMAIFACFLANNTLTACPDAFDDYVRHLMSSQPYGTDPDRRGTINPFEQLLNNYRHEKQTIINNLQNGAVITAENKT